MRTILRILDAKIICSKVCQYCVQHMISSDKFSVDVLPASIIGISCNITYVIICLNPR